MQRFHISKHQSSLRNKFYDRNQTLRNTLKSVLPVADSYFDKEIRTFSRIRAHQYTSATFNTSL